MTTNTQNAAGSFEGRIDHNPDLADGANSVVAIVSIKSNSPGASNIVAKKRVLGFVVDGQHIEQPGHARTPGRNLGTRITTFVPAPGAVSTTKP